MSDRWGSHWRWRVAMLVTAVSLIGYGWWQAGRWKARLLVNQSSTVAVYRVLHRDGRESLEAFDWTLRQRWELADMGRERRSEYAAWWLRLSPDGKKAVWIEDSQVHTVDIVSPDRGHACKVPFSLDQFDFVGLSRDGRFGAFQMEGEAKILPDGTTTVTPLDRAMDAKLRGFILKVLDLKSGEVVSSREWRSSMGDARVIGRQGFLSNFKLGSPFDPVEPPFGLWNLTDKGTWQLTERLKEPSVQKVWTAEVEAGAWRVINNPSSVGANTMVAERWVALTSDSGRKFITFANRGQAMLAGDFVTGKVLEIGHRDEMTGWFLTADGNRLVVSNRRDDLVIYDTATAKEVARDSAGSSRRNQLLAIGVALFGLAAAWVRIGMAERKLPWGMIDGLAAVLLVEVAVFPIYSSFYAEDWKPFPIEVFKVVPAGWLHGAYLGSAILTGWYWAHGRESFATRWVVGTLCLALLSVPVVVYHLSAEVSYELMVWHALMVTGIVIAGLTAGLVVLPRAIGWGIRPHVESPIPWRFGMLHLLVLTGSVGIALALVQSVLDLPGLVSLVDLSTWPSGSCFLGVPLVGVLFLRPRWAILLGAIAAVAIAAAGSYWYVENYGSAFAALMKPDRYVGEAVAMTSAAVAILLPCLVLRRHGWRWSRLPPANIALEAAA